MSTEPTRTEGAKPVPTQAELEAEIARTRAELASTIDELTTRLDPRTQAAHVAQQTKQAAADTGSFFTGGGLPEHDPARARNVKILVGGTVAAIALVAAAILRRRS
ncbi:DUF3618 domain-containing protein [Oerskovia sp. Sa1BUA8]|uniref:DUF3618 domain-containing protein n=1 Tax=Oerskovia douganii TaxID=2762210 RepID=A0A9D5YYX7_9CELL|nr:DUF3618 domain-containing protein [Oerskovia douganii]MBE7701153.1 DUF3618 domain-containing protein [Oerskovia douganii]